MRRCLLLLAALALAGCGGGGGGSSAIEVQPPTLTLEVGGLAPLTVIRSPQPVADFNSTNAAVAQVAANGDLTANVLGVGAGEAFILVTSGSATTQVHVTVLAPRAQ